MFLLNGAPIAAKKPNHQLNWEILSEMQKSGSDIYSNRVMPTVKLFRPVGQFEFDLIAASGFKSFPPRLPEQPIFYPVLNEEYATQIARDWNSTDERSGFTGYVLEFDIDSEFLSRYDVQKAGGAQHLEYWIPAQELSDFNRHIAGEIHMVSKFSGESST
jgi:hypothetical protein